MIHWTFRNIGSPTNFSEEDTLDILEYGPKQILEKFASTQCKNPGKDEILDICEYRLKKYIDELQDYENLFSYIRHL